MIPLSIESLEALDEICPEFNDNRSGKIEWLMREWVFKRIKIPADYSKTNGDKAVMFTIRADIYEAFMGRKKNTLYPTRSAIVELLIKTQIK